MLPKVPKKVMTQQEEDLQRRYKEMQERKAKKLAEKKKQEQAKDKNKKKEKAGNMSAREKAKLLLAKQQALVKPRKVPARRISPIRDDTPEPLDLDVKPKVEQSSYQSLAMKPKQRDYTNFRSGGNNYGYQYKTKQFHVTPSEGITSAMVKNYSFPPKQYSLPAANECFAGEGWKDPILMQGKIALNAAKSAMDDKELSEWGRHTSFTNKWGMCPRQVKMRVSPEMFSNAWPKLYEILMGYKQAVPAAAVERGELRTLHLCEAPGSFVSAMNHFIKSCYNECTWKWIATSLNPYYEGNDPDMMTHDDKFICATGDNWWFGSDNTGDITHADNIEGLAKILPKQWQGKAHIVTADGSIDGLDDPNEQESSSAFLHICEVITSIGCLEKGGTLILKMFNHFEDSSTCLMYLLNCLFQTLNVCKPETSKEGNSETYVVACDFQGSDVAWFTSLVEGVRQGKPASSLLSPSSIPQEFMETMRQVALYFSDLQRVSIERNLALFEEWDDTKKNDHARERHQAAEDFVHRLELLESLAPEDTITGGVNLMSCQHNPRREREHNRGSFHDKLNARRKEREEALQVPTLENLVVQTRKRKREEDSDDEEHGSKRVCRSGNGLSAKSVLEMEARGYIVLADDIPPRPAPIRPVASQDWRSQPPDPNTDPPRPVRPSSGEVKEWKLTIGTRVTEIKHSKFCSTATLRGKLKAASLYTNLTAVGSSVFNDACAWAGISTGVHSKGFAFAADPTWSHLMKDVDDAAQLTVQLFSKIDRGSKFVFVDLCGGAGGVSEYLLATASTGGCDVQGWIVHRPDRTAPDLDAFHDHPGVQLAVVPAGKEPAAVATNWVPTSGELASLAGKLHGAMTAAKIEAPHVVVADAWCGAGPESTASKLQLVANVQVAFRLLALRRQAAMGKGGTLVLRMGSMTSRFSVGILFLLYRHFRRVNIIRPQAVCPLLDTVVVVADKFIECSPVLIDYLSHQLKKLEELAKEPRHDILEIVPTTSILGRAFWEYIHECNESVGAQQIAAAESVGLFLKGTFAKEASDEGAELLRTDEPLGF